ncbi:hypothetical protein P167DRAFT_533155 [Morchella conica CCBAS932]|uniref:Uncharacterized protein n=1 Tax=Morchella conica CCBAS932 TaxID=1392247 RepID=A0A3N4L0W4_9PEZI|nr:hypothetical protein P167DRAFT_533155 [Morchella conica CCBAS932]
MISFFGSRVLSASIVLSSRLWMLILLLLALSDNVRTTDWFLLQETQETPELPVANWCVR